VDSFKTDREDNNANPEQNLQLESISKETYTAKKVAGVVLV